MSGVNTTPPATTTTLSAAADRLELAARRCEPCSPVRDLIGGSDAASAYAVQQQLTDRRVAAGSRVVGRKVGLTSARVQAQLGVGQPDFGVLFDDMQYASGAVLPSDRLLQPKAEAEIAFVLADDLDLELIDVSQVRSRIAYAVAALEIVDSRISDWDVAFADTVADNASSGVFVLGSLHRTLETLEPRDVSMSMTLDGEPVSSGTGAESLGDPLEAVAWLARTARAHGQPLRAGQVILSGALGPMADLSPGATVAAHLTGLGTVTATLAGGFAS